MATPDYVTAATPHPAWCERPTFPATHTHVGPLGSVRVGAQAARLLLVQKSNTEEPVVRLELVEADESWRAIDLPAAVVRRLCRKALRGADLIDPPGGEAP